MTALPSDSEILEHHYRYELDMLANTYRLLDDLRIQQNALIESFCIRARNLVEFFCKKDKGGKYTEESYVPFGSNKPQIDKLNILINQQISHLDVKKRTVDDGEKLSGKEFSELITIISAETIEFRKHLKPSYRGMSIEVIMQQQIPRGPSALAQNLPTSAPTAPFASTTTTPTALVLPRNRIAE